jgi:hypothetical protein
MFQVPPDVLAPQDPDSASVRSHVLESVCMVETGLGYGSGTLIEATVDPNGVYTYSILTACHVIIAEDGVSYRPFIRVKFFNSSSVEDDEVDSAYATVESVDIAKDLAILVVKTKRRFTARVAKILPTQIVLEQAVHVLTVGCGNFRRPYLADGRVVGRKFVVYQVAECSYARYESLFVVGPTIYGNSGGAVFVRIGDEYYLAGVVGAIAVRPDGDPIWTQGFSVPHTTVSSYLSTVGLQHLVR